MHDWIVDLNVNCGSCSYQRTWGRFSFLHLSDDTTHSLSCINICVNGSKLALIVRSSQIDPNSTYRMHIESDWKMFTEFTLTLRFNIHAVDWNWLSLFLSHEKPSQRAGISKSPFFNPSNQCKSEEHILTVTKYLTQNVMLNSIYWI